MSHRVAILTFGTRGDVQPFLALAKALLARGATPILGAHPPYQRMIEEAGVAFTPLTGDPLDWTMSQTRLNATAGQPRFFRELAAFRRRHLPLMRRMLDDSLELAAGADTLLYSHGALAGPHLAEALGCAAVYGGLQPWERTKAHSSVVLGRPPALPDTVRGWWNGLSHPLGEHLVWQPWRAAVNDWRRSSLGLPRLAPYRSPWRIAGRSLPHLYGYSPLVAPPPADWPTNRYVTGWWFGGDSGRPSERLSDFLAAGEPPVYIGFGSYVPEEWDLVRRTVLEAVAALGLRAIVAGGWARLDLDEWGDRILELEGAPHDWLFPRVAAVVHHGGAGTSGAAFRAGAPQVVIPAFFDQFFWAERVRALRVGPAPLPSNRLTAARLSAALEAALAAGHRERAGRLAASLEPEDGAGVAAELIVRRLAG